MDDPIEINRRTWDERAGIHARDSTGDYGLERFRAGDSSLHAIEDAELGDLSGKHVLHSQCHIGRDTLCLVRRGAIATGLDFSGAALGVARRLADETGLGEPLELVDQGRRLIDGVRIGVGVKVPALLAEKLIGSEVATPLQRSAAHGLAARRPGRTGCCFAG